MIAKAKFDLELLVKAKLPPLPGSVLKISSLLLDYNCSQRKIADAVGCDPMLASRILRLANSPIYSFQQKITSLTTAVGALGNKAIYEMIVMGMIADSFPNEIRNSIVGRDNWLHSLAVAIGARELCGLMKLRGVDEAFTCGLMHDIGKILIFKADSALFTEMFNQSDSNDMTYIEREVLGFDHAQVGALAARRWNLSDSVCNMILYHHDPTTSLDALLMTHVINIADNLAYLKNHKKEYGEEFLNSASMLTLDFKPAQLDAVWEKVVTELREVLRAFF
ncbi:MAG TPA: HDOD domain-containing protein [Pyrinomonadaceae bacterium]|nr:HDOD domain-containing protein [Pyrinomonadaceae bacterium]